MTQLRFVSISSREFRQRLLIEYSLGVRDRERMAQNLREGGSAAREAALRSQAVDSARAVQLAEEIAQGQGLNRPGLDDNLAELARLDARWGDYLVEIRAAQQAADRALVAEHDEGGHDVSEAPLIGRVREWDRQKTLGAGNELDLELVNLERYRLNQQAHNPWSERAQRTRSLGERVARLAAVTTIVGSPSEIDDMRAVLRFENHQIDRPRISLTHNDA